MGDEALVALAAPPEAAGAVRTMIGYRMAAEPGEHRGLPSPYLTLVFSLSGPLPIHVPSPAGRREGAFRIPLGGLHTRAVLLPRRLPQAPTAAQRGIQLAVHPLAARAVFGVPAAALTDEVLEVGDVVGPLAGLTERLAADPTGPDAVAAVNGWLRERTRAAAASPAPRELARAWRLIVGSDGRARIGDVARDVGWSRAHLTRRLRAEIGVGAKDLARLARFQRSRRLMTGRPGELGQIAQDSGYADQSHLTAEWREFAGCTPGHWLNAELADH